MPKTPPVDKRRWILTKKPLPRKVALENRVEETRWIRAVIKERQEELRHLLLVPLPKFTQEYVAVLPGDPRYEKGETRFDPKSFTGTWKFVTDLPL